jgi:hypothetical protein
MMTQTQITNLPTLTTDQLWELVCDRKVASSIRKGCYALIRQWAAEALRKEG